MMKQSIGKIFTVMARFFVVTCLLAVLCLSQTGITGAATLVKKIDDRDPAIIYSGVWKDTSSSAYYQSTGKYTTTANSYCQFPFYGPSIRWYGVKATDHGKADVYIDGVWDQTVDCYYSGVWTANTLLYTKAGLTAGPHTIKIVVRSDRNPSATANYVEIDAFEFECAEVPPMLYWEGAPSSVTLEPFGVVHTQSSADSFISFGNKISQFGTNDFTVALWFKTNDQSRIINVIGNRTATSHGNFFCVRMAGIHPSEPQGELWAEVDQDSAGTNYIGLSSREAGLNDGNWHHFAVTRQGVTLKLYIDGNLSTQGSASGIANIANGNPFRTGWPGVISPDARYSDIRIYDLALTAEQVCSVFAIKPPQTVSDEQPIVVTVSPASHPVVPSDLKECALKGPDTLEDSPTEPVLKWHGKTYWAYSFVDNRYAMAIVSYDANGNMVQRKDKDGARYIWKITVDAATKTVTFWGQSSLTIVMKWDEL